MRRLARFNVVGAIGFALQLGVLTLLQRTGSPVFLAIEAAVLHNFLWHEHWTWADMRVGSWGRRFWRFHLTNGLISLIGTGAITIALATLGMPLVAANAAAVVTCAGANFLLAHTFVFCATTWPIFHGHLE
jgi:putative flippase GtrA